MSMRTPWVVGWSFSLLTSPKPIFLRILLKNPHLMLTPVIHPEQGHLGSVGGNKLPSSPQPATAAPSAGQTH
jgi:hypothetical protein